MFNFTPFSFGLRPQRHSWWYRLIRGILLIGVATILIMWPQIVLIVFAYLIAFFAFLKGCLDVLAAVRQKSQQNFKEWRNKDEE